VTGDGIQVRRGTLDDLAQIREITRRTFSWGDYLPHAWERWVASKHGDLLVATLDGMVAGTARVSFLGNREAWLEGVRVRREYRQRGVASELIKRAHECATGQKCRVIRLETGSKNFGAQRTFKKFGYRRVVGYAEFKNTPRIAELDRVRPAKLVDAKACWEQWQHSWFKRSSREIVPAVFGWRWWKLTQSRLRQDIRAKRVWVSPNGFMVLRDKEEAFDIIAIVGAKNDAMRLLNAARAISARAGKKIVYWIAPHANPAHRLAAQAGFTCDEDGLDSYPHEF